MNLTYALGAMASLLRRRRKLALTIFFLVGILGTLAVWITPPMYAANTTLLAKFGREYTYRNDTQAGGSFVPSITTDDIVNTVVEILKSDALAEQVVTQAGPENLYPLEAEDPPKGMTSLQAATLEFQRWLKVTPTRRSNVIVVEYRHPVPEIAANTLNQFVDAFQTKYLGLYGESRNNFMVREVEAARQAYTEASQEVTKFEEKNSTFAKDTQVDSLLLRRADLATQKARVQACCAGSSALEDIQRQLAELDARVNTINEAQATLSRLVRRRELMQEAYDSAERKAQESRISRALDESRLSSVQVIDAATPPPRPARPGRTIKTLLVLFFAGLLACACAFLAEARRRRFTTGAELRRSFGLPVLAEVRYDRAIARSV